MPPRRALLRRTQHRNGTIIIFNNNLHKRYGGTCIGYGIRGVMRAAHLFSPRLPVMRAAFVADNILIHRFYGLFLFAVSIDKLCINITSLRHDCCLLDWSITRAHVTWTLVYYYLENNALQYSHRIKFYSFCRKAARKLVSTDFNSDKGTFEDFSN